MQLLVIDMSNDSSEAMTFNDVNASSVILLLFGLVAVIASSLVVYAFCKSRKLRRKGFALLCLSSINDLLAGACFASMGVAELAHLIDLHDVGGSVCCSTLSLMFTCETLALYLALSMAIDRFIAVMRPVLYERLSFVYVQLPMVLFTVVFTTTQTALMVVNTVDKQNLVADSCDIIYCTGSPNYLMLIQGVNLFFSSAIIVICLTMICIMRYKHKQFRTRGMPHLGEFNFKQQTRQIRLQLGVMFITVISQISGRVCIVLATFATSFESYDHLVKLFRTLICCNSAMNFFVYVIATPDVRTCIKQLFVKPNNRVSPF
ncbi:unnamed protein product [Soboliphyme baturini]|uniref:G_PROTEIN_RECEP_F1_2 domain-containing protein n=1 Tax=Soboliphyme baturini TaxID=241478 RepID=A0A183J0D2_9BILA|nr:unnamed protein product [Soboliphyme baturini]